MRPGTKLEVGKTYYIKSYKTGSEALPFIPEGNANGEPDLWYGKTIFEKEGVWMSGEKIKRGDLRSRTMDIEEIEESPNDFACVGDRVYIELRSDRRAITKQGVLVRIFQRGKKEGKGSVLIDGNKTPVTTSLLNVWKVKNAV